MVTCGQCGAELSEFSHSEFFCSEDCQRAWQGRGVYPLFELPEVWQQRELTATVPWWHRMRRTV